MTSMINTQYLIVDLLVVQKKTFEPLASPTISEATGSEGRLVDHEKVHAQNLPGS
jgi:hypothetical protein